MMLGCISQGTRKDKYGQLIPEMNNTDSWKRGICSGWMPNVRYPNSDGVLLPQRVLSVTEYVTNPPTPPEII